jgi:hypothetical protein
MGGRSISLYSLENDVIRPMGDPRVHFALNCMSVSCPRLPRTAFTADGLDRELDAAAREFVGDDRNVHFDRETRTVTLSAIFDFYTKDFLAKAPSLIATSIIIALSQSRRTTGSCLPITIGPSTPSHTAKNPRDSPSR